MLENEWRKLPEKMLFNKRKRNPPLNDPGLALITFQTTGAWVLQSLSHLTTLLQNFGTRQTRCIMGDVQVGKISWPSYFLGINRESVSSHTFINCILELQTFSSGK